MGPAKCQHLQLLPRECKPGAGSWRWGMRIREPQDSGCSTPLLSCGNPCLPSGRKNPVWFSAGWGGAAPWLLTGRGAGLGIAWLLLRIFQSSSLFSVPLSLLLFKKLVLPLPEVFQDSARHFHQCPLQPLPNMQFLFLDKLPFLILLFVFKYYDLEFWLPPAFFQDISASWHCNLRLNFLGQKWMKNVFFFFRYLNHNFSIK